MADAKSAGRGLVAQTAGGGADDVETALRGVEGKVRQQIVTKLRQLVDRDPAAFVRNMRSWMGEGRSDD
jgi:hypothetical protein